MMYTMRAGVDRQTKDKIAKGLLYGTGVIVTLAIAIAPFTGNNTFWSGRSRSSNAANEGTSDSNNPGTTAGKMKTKSGNGTSSPTANVPAPQASASKVNVSSASGALPAATDTSGSLVQSAPVVGRGGDTTTSKTQTPVPDTVSSPTGPAPAALPVTVCTPTTSIDPLLTANPVCVN